MNRKKLGSAALGSLLALSLAATACSKNETETATGTPQPSGSAAASGSPAASAKPVDPFAKYDPPIEVTTVRSIDATFKFAAGDSLDSNVWTKIFEKDYGIKVKNLWTVDTTQYRQKLNVSIASGDLPDFLLVNKEEMNRLAESGMLEDLTKVWEQYATPFGKALMKEDGGIGMKAATYGGKLVGIPATTNNGGISTAQMVYIRTDWLQKLGLQEPKTLDELFKVATAFAKQDPDGNGKADTYGLAINKDFLDMGHGSLVGLFNSYHTFTDIWLPDAGGKLVYSSLQKELKEPLKKLQELYKDGVLDKEFGVKPVAKVGEDIAAGRIGLVFGNVADGGVYQKENHTKDPKAQWKTISLVSNDGKPAVPQLSDTAGNFYVVKKGAKHPEAMVKLADIYWKLYYETNYAPNPNPYITDAATGIFPARYVPVAIDSLNTNLNAYRLLQEALKNKDGSKLGFPATVHFDRMSKFLAGDDTMWFSNMVFGNPDGSSYSTIDKYDKAKIGQYNTFQGPATPTMADKLPTLKKKEIETFTKIIMGDAGVDEFDKFAGEFKTLGGDAIEKEVNDWYAKNK